MLENNRKDILLRPIEYSFISLLSNKIKVLIVGGGRAGFIKAKTLSNNGCRVKVISKNFSKEFEELKKLSNVQLIKDEYKKDYISENHLIIIAVEDETTNEIIRKHCDEQCKLYLDCSHFERGLFVVPCQRSSKTATFGINTKGGSPKTAIYLAEEIKDNLIKKDSFIEYSYKLRNIINKSEDKATIMDFVATEDFYFFYNKNKHKIILEMFFGGNYFEVNSSHKKEYFSTNSNRFSNKENRGR
ncbi:precorrin-2 dehydrogenase [Clostridium tetani]|uniref:precorrin-2 dehydrogenase n=1 Tax=Clostridium tetani (strain Massachusetts / E88) TaxID=212717 RepID=Q897K8_CLOTE|nr:NAD(P)-dependent oxidoreductase [Clostridium tetani]AAO35328.1 putative precorrin-2 dehydrogenase/oxidase [Clostridium tetani E88]WFN62544.1 NAD(P)-dependent oxidoreductase [Clostridium tetani]SKA12848.1 precorrin-2 dehydrogenase / sirohydrochlorin ferrochelatase [Clostridium tetani]BDR63611.1 precorrin-2 dehydrogenase [Clostridium tetani]BDR69130.1 precorrin-2 dehydrogenase [Clostridium tetani]